MRLRKRLVAVVVASFGVLFAPMGLTVDGQTSAVEQPDRIVPFSADYRLTITTAKGQEVQVGRFFRSSNDSFRRESGPTLDRITLINVSSVDDGVFYVWSEHGGMSVFSLAAPPLGWRVYPRTVNGVGGIREKFEDFDAIRSPDGGGFGIEVPASNYFVVHSKWCTNDGSFCREEQYSSIRIAPQPPELFKNFAR